MNQECWKAHPLLALVDAARLEQLCAQRHIRQAHFAKDMVLHQAGDYCHALELVMSGRLCALAASENGGQSRLFSFDAGGIIGANLLLSGHGEYPFTIQALSDCIILQMDKAAVLDCLHEYDFTLRFIQSVSQNSHGMNRRVVMLTRHTLRENLLEYLRSLAVEQRCNQVTLPISKKQLAEELGVQRPSLFRELKRLEDEGVLEVQNRSIRLR